jgi:FKBP-type peptidyl-prolyl cis-trans isomerase
VRRLLIPPALAYGGRNVGNGLIPPNSTLLFEIELLAVESVTLAPQSE